MITLTTEQAQQIEESLESCFCYDQNDQRYLPSAAEEALATIRAARAQEQAEQEPVAWMHKCGGVCSAYDKEHMFGLDYFNIPLYAAQQPVQDIMEAVDAAMAEMQNINPPLRRSECERLIRAANSAAPVRTKDLTDDEILPDGYGVVTTYDGLLEFARAVIAADRELNR